MNLPFTPSPNPTRRQYFFSLEIGSGVLQTAIWTYENSKVQVLSCGTYEKFLHSSDFITAADQSLTQSALSLKIDPAEIKRVILGLPASWLSQEKILPERSKFLKEICQKLSLKPIGFVVTAEAVVRYLHSTEGVPPTAIIIGVSGSDLEVTVVRLGKIVGVHTVKRGSSISEDVKEGLARFLPTDLFPSRILLYDHGVELESLRQTLLSFPWQSPQHRLPFLHFPKIDILPSDTSVKAISVTAGAEAVLNQPEKNNSVAPEAEVGKNSTDLGFVEDVDLALSSSVSAKKTITSSNIPRPKFKPKINLSLPAVPVLRLIPVLLLVVGIILLPLFYWYRFVSAKVILNFIPQTISTQFTAQLPLTAVSTEADTEITIPTTGQVLIGDKASGVATIVNGTQQLKTFLAGTELTSDAGLKFVTSENVTIPSASGSADPNSYQPGRGDVKITAVNIGQDSNLSAGSEFKIGSFSKLDYVARNTNALSGGTSRQAQAVTKKDLADAKALADNDLSSKSQAALQNTLSAGSVLLPSTVTQKIISESYNHKENEAADQLTYIKKIKTEAKTYQQSDLDRLVEEKLTPLYPPHSKLLSSPISDITFKANLANINAHAQVAPDINPKDYLKQLRGQPVTIADTMFRDIPGLSKVSVEFNPAKANWFKRFPIREENLSIFSSFSTE